MAYIVCALYKRRIMAAFRRPIRILMPLSLAFASDTLYANQSLDLVVRVNVLIGTTGPDVNYGGVCPWVAPPMA